MLKYVCNGLVAQRTEQVPSKDEMEVRFFPGSPEPKFDIIRRSGGTVDAYGSGPYGL